MKKLETGNIGIGNTSTLATFNKMIAIVALLAVGGCKMKEFSSTPLAGRVDHLAGRLVG